MLAECIKKCFPSQPVGEKSNCCAIPDLPQPIDILQTLSHPVATHLSDMGFGIIFMLILNEFLKANASCDNATVKVSVSAIIGFIAGSVAIGGAYVRQKHKNDLYKLFYGDAGPSDFFSTQVEALALSSQKKNPTEPKTEGLAGDAAQLRRQLFRGSTEGQTSGSPREGSFVSVDLDSEPPR